MPDISVWDLPHRLLVKSMEMRVGGHVNGPLLLLIASAVATRNSAQIVADYAERSAKGAGRVIKVLMVAKTAGEIAEMGLVVAKIGSVARVGSKVASKSAKDSVDKLADKYLTEYIKRNPELAGELNAIRVVPGPKGTVLGSGRKAGQSNGAGRGFQTFP